MSTLSNLGHIQSYAPQSASQSPTHAFASARGAFNAQRQLSVMSRSAPDAVVISPEARAQMAALDQLQVSSRVVSTDPKGTRISVFA